MGITTALQLAHANLVFIRKNFRVVLERTVRELNGESCISLEEVRHPNSKLSAGGPSGSLSRRMKLCGRQSVSTLNVQLKSCAVSGSSAGILLYL